MFSAACALGEQRDPGAGQPPQALRLRELLQLLQRVVLDLADPLAGHSERPPHLLERQRLVARSP
jgi:hypothetical protein